MTRLLINFFLSLCFFLFKGHSHLYASVDQNYVYRSMLQHSENTVHIRIADVRSDQAMINNKPASGAKKEKIKATEVEDEEESLSGRKHLEISHYYHFDPLEPAVYYNYLKNPLPFCNHFSYLFSDKFIVHRVIRV
ncbi:hypothetical protein [Chitinophaga ginsengisoli]|uniref:Uncharacterized protein n=1 Tax=Chitinophaga ginsengisoli TaxID=363837 RepID=A0A2P8GE13_9BACT|nr:hypothetical protein [Chitinophaga ginsengisoli]PSL32223.1 hypothetical protein CLV42_104526 [Chitinophaga ginsengisoli]